MSRSIAFICVALALTASACSRKTATRQPPSQSQSKDEPEPKADEREVNMTPGDATRLGPPPNRRKLWTVRWKEARLRFDQKGRFAGEMEEVTGSIYDERGNETSTFQGTDGEADKLADVLRLEGQVKVVSTAYKATLLCDKVEYHPNEKRIRATGNVRIVTANGTLNAGSEVLTTPDLREIATPNLFRK